MKYLIVMSLVAIGGGAYYGFSSGLLGGNDMDTFDNQDDMIASLDDFSDFESLIDDDIGEGFLDNYDSELDPTFDSDAISAGSFELDKNEFGMGGLEFDLSPDAIDAFSNMSEIEIDNALAELGIGLDTANILASLEPLNSGIMTIDPSPTQNSNNTNSDIDFGESDPFAGLVIQDVNLPVSNTSSDSNVVDLSGVDMGTPDVNLGEVEIPVVQETVQNTTIKEEPTTVATTQVTTVSASTVTPAKTFDIGNDTSAIAGGLLFVAVCATLICQTMFRRKHS